MATKVKIKIHDDSELRMQLDSLYENATQLQIAKWSLQLASHILEQFAPQFLNNEAVLKGFDTNESWQQGLSRMHDVRQAGFSIHRLAKEQENQVLSTALRVVGQAVATGHMKEHGMVASDYAIKCCNIVFPNDVREIEKERNWQIKELKSICLL